jgi:hypothetical protein
MTTLAKYSWDVLCGRTVEHTNIGDDQLPCHVHKYPYHALFRPLWGVIWFTYGIATYLAGKWKLSTSRANALADPFRANQKTATSLRAGMQCVATDFSAKMAKYYDHRAQEYLYPLSVGITQNLARYLCGQYRPMARRGWLSDVMQTSPMSNGLVARGDYAVWGDDPDFGSWLQHTRIHPDYRRPHIQKFRMHLETMECGYWDGEHWHAEEQATDEDVKVMAAMIGRTITIGGGHSWVHFHLASIFTEAVDVTCQSGSVLSRLLRPHAIFTNSINEEALWERKSTTWNPSSLTYSFDCESNDSVLGGIWQGVVDHYTSSRCVFLKYEDDHPVLIDTPYSQSLHAYYRVIRRFVEALSSDIDKDEYRELESHIRTRFVGTWFPEADYSEHDRMVIFLTYVIHLVCIQHSQDHYTFWRWINALQGMVTRLPSGSHEFDAWEAMKTQNGNNMYSYTYPNAQNPTIETVVYGLDAAERQFKSELEECGHQLRSRNAVMVPPSRMFTSISG